MDVNARELCPMGGTVGGNVKKEVQVVRRAVVGPRSFAEKETPLVDSVGSQPELW